MLRTKQINTLSNCARSFFISGSRNGVSDGSTCSCSEDEICIPRRQQHSNKDVSDIQKSPPLASRASPRAGTLISGSVTKLASSHRAEITSHPTAIPQEVKKSGIVNYATDFDSSPPVADQFFRASVAAVSFLSDLVNYKIPISDGGGTLTSAQNCMVDPTRPAANVNQSNSKSIKREKFSKVHARSPNPSPSSYNSSYSSANYKGDKAGKSSSGGSRDVFDAAAGNPVERPKTLHSDIHFRRTSVPQRSKAYSNSNRFFSSSHHVQGSDPRAVETFSKPGRDARVVTGVVSNSRQSGHTVHIVDSVSNILLQMGWGPDADEELKKLNCSMDAYQANQVLKKLQDHTVALGFFQWLKRQVGFKHDGHTYTTMIGILGRARQFSAINNLLDQMVRDGCQPNVVTYNRLIHSYRRANYLSKAISVFDQMQEAGCEPDRVTYCTLIDIHAKAGFLDVAMDMYRRMQIAGLSPDTFTYSVMINCLGKAGYLADAHRLFREMIDKGCVPNVVTYNILIALQAKTRNYESALELYRDMQNAGYEPDKVTYSIVMEVLGHCGYLEEAEAVFGEMGRKNWVPDEPVYGLLVDLWGKAGRVDKASQWYRAMLNAGLRPNVPTCNSLLGAFLRVHRLADAYDLLQGMLQLGLSPSLQTYTLLLSCCTDARSSFDMSFCCQLMATTGHPAHVFLLSLPPSGPDGQNVRDHMGKFLDLMHSEDRESKRGLVDAVVDFLHKSGLKEEAGLVWEVAAEKNVYPDAVREKASCYWLINLHVMSDGTAVTALSRTLAWFRRQLLLSGVGPSRIDIVTGWGRRSRVTGSSLVRQSVQELLNIFSFPFFTENGNSGCFVGCGEPLNRWLHQSYVERMHLL